MVMPWKKLVIQRVWHRAGNSSSIDQFHQINLLNVEGTIFFTVVAQRLSIILMNNTYIGSVQKAGIGVFPKALSVQVLSGNSCRQPKRKRKICSTT